MNSVTRPASLLLLLVDWDNLPATVRHRGAVYAIDSVLALVPKRVHEATNRVSVRLYGGWYEGDRYTRIAEQLDADLSKSYPSTCIIGSSSEPITHRTPVPIDVDLATMLMSSPRIPIHRTLRRRSGQLNIRAQDPRRSGCRSSPCALSGLVDFLNGEPCPERGCTMDPSAIIVRDEQKMVDTLLASDLLYAALHVACTVGIVTSDDDLVPPMRLALDVGKAHILHVLTKHDTPARRVVLRDHGGRYSNTVPMDPT